MTNKLKKLLITAAALAALALGGSALAGAASNGGGSSDAGDASKAIAGGDKAKAEEAALAKVGAGSKVNQSELDNENGATYEVEVAKADGSTVDVRLDDAFKVVVVEADSEQGDGGNDEVDQGADQNKDEAGHQDEKAGESDGETADDAAR